MEDKVHPGHVPYGEIQGYANGVPAYSNLHDGHFSGIWNVDERIKTGFRWQCVEFARRWLLERKGLYLPDIDHAGNIFSRDYVEDIKTGERVRMVAVPNNGINKPCVDALLIYPQLKGVADWGHVAVITEVSSFDEKSVERKDMFCRIADQNQHFHKWEGSHYSAELHFVEQEVDVEGEDGNTKNKEKRVFLEDKLGGSDWRPTGWMIFPDSPNRDPAQPLQWHDKYVLEPFDRMRLERCTIKLPNEEEDGKKEEKEKEEKKPWLDVSNPAEKKFVETFGMDVSRTRLNEAEANYYICNFELLLRSIEASNVLQRVFVKETAKVIASDELMARFKIPSEFWGRIRKSWETQPHSITARFDFVIDDKNVMKCFEYNADSASTLLECGRIQEKYAQHIGIADGSWSSGWHIESHLTQAWRRAQLQAAKGITHNQSTLEARMAAADANVKAPIVHFCVDDDEEEEYTALYVVEFAEKNGIRTKLCKMFDEFSFKEVEVEVKNEGGTSRKEKKIKIVDKEDNIVETIWKTWMWETAFADYFKAKAERGDGWKPAPTTADTPAADRVRLCDLLLSEDDDITVFEPMWKVIPSNKAILPMIYESNPNCPFILPAFYEVTESLKKTGYATKPIVGRTGQNVTVTSETGALLSATEGNFGARDMVYQEKFNITRRDDYYAILGGWMIGGESAGISIREDKTIITGVESPYSALRIVLDEEAVKKVSEENAAKNQ